MEEGLALRNDMAHAAAPEEGAVLHDWVARMTRCVRRLYHALLPLAHSSTVVVEDLNYRDGRFELGLRRLDGVGEHETVTRVASEKPYTKGHVYLATPDGGRLLSLHPWVVWTKCPLCFRHELFFFNAVKGRQSCYVTPDRGHCWACDVSDELRQMYAVEVTS